MDTEELALSALYDEILNFQLLDGSNQKGIFLS